MTNLTHCANQHYAVLGLGRAGMAAVKALQAGGAQVSAWDDGQSTREHAEESLGVPLISPESMEWKDMLALVLSPGIPLTHPEPHAAVGYAKAAGCPVIGDVELLYRQHPNTCYIGITGTNGKSTTTALLSHILQEAGKPVAMGGNIGVPALSLEMQDDTLCVLELSSYQLDLLDQFHCNVAVWLNITPDHLDRHGGLEGYVAAKRRIFRHMTRDDVAVIGIDDVHSRTLYDMMMDYDNGPRVIGLSLTDQREGLGEDAVTVSRTGATCELTLHRPGKQPQCFTLKDISSLRGMHNAQNAAAAVAVAASLGVSHTLIQQGLHSFAGLAHRMEEVAMQGRVRFVNDSKATNAEAAAKALSSYERIYWIAGGVAKAGGIHSLLEYTPRIRKAYLIGEAAEEFAHTLEGRVEVEQCGTLEVAVQRAAADASLTGEDATVLLSPACASFDQFRDFEVRGAMFRRAVDALTPAMEGSDEAL